MSQGAQAVICPGTKIVAATRGFTALLGVPLTTDQASCPGFRAGATIRDRITDVGGRKLVATEVRPRRQRHRADRATTATVGCRTPTAGSADRGPHRVAGPEAPTNTNGRHAMLGRKTYTQDEIDRAKTTLTTQLGADDEPTVPVARSGSDRHRAGLRRLQRTVVQQHDPRARPLLRSSAPDGHRQGLQSAQQGRVDLRLDDEQRRHSARKQGDQARAGANDHHAQRRRPDSAQPERLRTSVIRLLHRDRARVPRRLGVGTVAPVATRLCRDEPAAMTPGGRSPAPSPRPRALTPGPGPGTWRRRSRSSPPSTRSRRHSRGV